MSDRSFLLAKAEVTYGTDPVPAAVDFVLAENVQYRLMGARERGAPAKPGVGQVPGQVYGEHAQLTFEVPLAASGTAGTAPKWGVLPKACGWGEVVSAGVSVTYSLAADPQAAGSLTLIWNDGRRLHKMTGCRGRMGLRLAAGKRPMLTFTFLGLYVPVTTRALPVHADATFTGWNDANPIAQGRTTFTLGGVNVPLRELSIEASDNVLFNDLPHQENVTLRGARTFSGQVRGTTPLPSALSLETPWTAGTITTAVVVHETAAGRICTVNLKAQLGQPDYGDDRGEDVFTSALDLTPSALNLDDEFTLVLT
ncbi:MAG: phage tail tube protein [Caulobacter sp.]